MYVIRRVHRTLQKPPYTFNLSTTRKVTVNIGSLTAGTTLSWTSVCLEHLEENPEAPFHLSVEEASWVGCLLDVGAFLAAIPSAWFVDKIGRRPAILICTCVPHFISWSLALFVYSPWQLYIARLLAGMGLGGISVLAPMYVGETAGDKGRSFLGSIFPLAFSMGILLTYVLVACGLQYLPLTIFLGCLPVLNAVAVCLLAPETPTWYMRAGRRNKAAQSLCLLGRPVEQNLVQLAKELASAPPSVKLSTVLRCSGYRKRLIACVILFMFQQFSGINAVMFYTVGIFKAADTDMDPVHSSCLVAGLQIVAIVCVAMLINRTGRRTYLLGSGVIIVACHLAMAAYFHLKIIGKTAPGWLPLSSLLLFVVAFSFGFGSVPWVQIHELSLRECAATLSAAAMLSNWGTDTLVTKTFGPAAHAWGEHSVYYTYAGINALGVVLVLLLVPETRYKQQHEIFPQNTL